MHQDARRRLEDVLDREIEAARQLAATLAAEQAALTGDSPQAVEQKAAEKLQLLNSIEKLEVERRELCPTPNGPGLAAAVAERWRALMEVVAGCRTANEVNGHIIHVRQHHRYSSRRTCDHLQPTGKDPRQSAACAGAGLSHARPQPPCR